MDSPATTRANLAELIGDPARLAEVPREAIPQLRGELAQLDTLLLGRLLAAGQDQGAPEDQLLAVQEAATRLGCSPDYLYRHHSRFPFTRRVGRKLLFSARGLEKHIAQKKPL
jgi:hypothetical protein